MIVANSRKKSPVTYSEIPPFFSLVDYRNNYFTSNDPKKIMEFYKSFENREQLIEWMKERPKGVANIHEVDGDKDVIVVIPTADFNGKYASNCRDNIFKGLHMIFVESGEIPDAYFNFAHNCNIGIVAAFKYKPNWIIISNDDKILHDESCKLKDEIKRIDLNEVRVLLPSNAVVGKICVQNKLGRLAKSLFKGPNKVSEKETELKVKYKVFFENKNILQMLLNKIFLRQVLKTRFSGSFFIMNFQLCKKYYPEIFDETYINGMEDIDLFLRFYGNNEKVTTVDYIIHDVISGSFGKSAIRYRYFGMANRAYFNFKNKDLLSALINSSQNKGRQRNDFRLGAKK